MAFELTILGCNSAVPAYGRHPSSQILKTNNHQFLIDCGEGTQFQLSKYKIKRSKINHIFISHMHGDHYFGLAGLLSTFYLNGRKESVNIYAPPELESIIRSQVTPPNSFVNYNILFHPLNFETSSTILELEDIIVQSFPVTHRIPCCGFSFHEKKQGRSIIGEKMKALNIPYDRINDIRKGADFISKDGTVIANNEITEENTTPLSSYAYSADTSYNEDIIPIIKNVSTLYHDCTFGCDFQDRALATKHSTSHDAATIAKKAKVNQLILGHYSAKYKEIEFLKEEAQSIFKNTDLALEGKVFKF